MSYGIWRKRGKGWSSIEIDTPGNRGEALDDLLYPYWFQDIERKKKQYHSIKSRARKAGIDIDGSMDYHLLLWEANQKINHPERNLISYWPGGGEHVRYISFDPEAITVESVMRLHEDDQSDIDLVLKREGRKEERRKAEELRAAQEREKWMNLYDENGIRRKNVRVNS